jgi:isoaspartyl peptidase/L-asparaginase-like protein (Ntn-hydrolase superfamily)
MLGLDGGRFVAASSTSGMPYKLPGRVGDSPIVGAGIYADDEKGAAGATGLGEALWKQCASFAAVEAMGRGLTAEEACVETVDSIRRRQPASRTVPCVVLALDRSGGYGAATSHGEFDLWVWSDGRTTRHQVRGPEG